MTRHVALAVGDTAGHVLPALALADAYAHYAGPVAARIITAGEGSGHWLVRRSGLPLHVVPGTPFAREPAARQLRSLIGIARAVGHARRILVAHGIRLVIGTGGYGSVATVLAARTLGLRTAIIEPNVLPGLANRWLARLVHRAYVAFDEARHQLRAERVIVTGLPVHAGATRHATARRPPVSPRLRLLIVSGSRGALFFSRALPALIAALRRDGLDVHVRHQAGPHVASTVDGYAGLGERVEVLEFIDDMPAALEWADVVIARAGAGTIADLTLAGVPALLVPWVDAASDHQAANAEALVRRGAALTIREEAWTTVAAAQQLRGLVEHPSAWTAMSRAVAALGTRDAAARIVDDCEALMEGRW